MEIQKTTKQRWIDMFVSGFALFAIFFGAGNLIFPPSAGLRAGQYWPQAMWGFLFSDPVLPIVGVFVTAFLGGKATDLAKRVHPTFAKVLGAVAILTIGPFFSVPRTSAMTHEMAISGIFPGIPQWATSVVFFALTYFLAINETGVVDAIGKYLTPGLLVVLTALIIKGIVSPIGPTATVAEDAYFALGFKDGYQTMDALGSMLMTGIVFTDLYSKGYKTPEQQKKIMLGVGLVAFVALAFVYGGLTYIGATAGELFPADTDRVVLFNGAVKALFGEAGKTVVALATALACLTTSVGLTATCGNFFSEISHNKLSYKNVVIAACGVSFLLSLFGVQGLINLAAPILSFIYPMIILLILFGLFNRYLPYDATFRGGVIGAACFGLIDALHTINSHWLSGLTGILKTWPLAHFGFEWLLPTLVIAFLWTLPSLIKHGAKRPN